MLEKSSILFVVIYSVWNGSDGRSAVRYCHGRPRIEWARFGFAVRQNGGPWPVRSYGKASDLSRLASQARPFIYL